MDKKTTTQLGETPEQALRRMYPEMSDDQINAQLTLNSMKASTPPLGGALPPVAIPPLDQQHQEGLTMDQQAKGIANAGGPFQPVPPELAGHPQMRQGVGSQILANQPPGLAQQADAYRPALGAKSRADLEQFAADAQELQARQAAAAREKEDDSRPVPAGTGIDAQIMQDLEEMDPAQWDKLNNPRRRREIESKLDEMNFEDIILRGELRQDVAVRPKFVLTFRTVDGSEDLAVKHLMYEETGSARYLLDKFSMMQMSLALVAVNGVEYPSHMETTKAGKSVFSEEKFLEKFDRIMKFPIEVLQDIGIQYMWFHERIRDLMLDETGQLKNG